MSYNTIEPERIITLRFIADTIKDTTELNALALMFGLRTMQEAEEDMVTRGDGTVDLAQIDELGGREECYARAMDYIDDTVNSYEMKAIIADNDFGDYSLKAVATVTLKRSI